MSIFEQIKEAIDAASDRKPKKRPLFFLKNEPEIDKLCQELDAAKAEMERRRDAVIEEARLCIYATWKEIEQKIAEKGYVEAKNVHNMEFAYSDGVMFKFEYRKD